MLNIFLFLVIVIILGVLYALAKFFILKVPPDMVYVIERFGVPRKEVIERQLKTAIIKNSSSNAEGIVEDPDEVIEEDVEEDAEEDVEEDFDENIDSDIVEDPEEEISEDVDDNIDSSKKSFSFKTKKPAEKQKKEIRFKSFSRLILFIPKWDTIRKKVPLGDVQHDVVKIKAPTADRIDMMLDTYIIYRVFDPISFTYEIKDFDEVLEQFSKTALLNRIGKMLMQEVIEDVEKINDDLAKNLSKIMNTQKYGFKIVSFVIQERTPPISIKEAMEAARKEELDGQAKETKALYELKVSAAENEKAEARAESLAKQKRTKAEADVYQESLLLAEYVKHGLGEYYVKEKIAKSLADGNATVISGSEATFGLLNSVSPKNQKAIKAAVASEAEET